MRGPKTHQNGTETPQPSRAIEHWVANFMDVLSDILKQDVTGACSSDVLHVLQERLAQISALTPLDDISNLGIVNAQPVSVAPWNTMKQPAVVSLDFGQNHTLLVPLDSEKVYLHECQVCTKRFKSRSGNPVRCGLCRTRNWKTGKTKWDIGRERKMQQLRTAM